MITQKITRLPAVASSFYPAEKEVLKNELFFYLEKAKLIEKKDLLKILIVPHAGIVFSGQTAAWGFKQLEKNQYQRVILLGVSHYFWFDYAAVFPSSFWQTPLAKTEVDENLAKKIINQKEKIIFDEKPHLPEHCLEVALIFLQLVLKNFKIVPILISNPTEILINYLAQKVADSLDEKTLLVVSSDLSHYPSYNDAIKIDQETIKGILSGKKELFEKAIKAVKEKNYPGLETAACGEKAISTALKVGEILNINSWEKLHYQNSGDNQNYQNKNQVVGYVAVAGYQKIGKKNNQNQIIFLDEKAKKEALKISRLTLNEFVKNKKIPPLLCHNPLLYQPFGCFVTLKKGEELRGCLGEFEPKIPLWQVIQKMTIASASQDPRFSPVAPQELKDIKIEISVISPKKLINDWRKIKLEKQGVVIEKGFNVGTFLPQVAQETGWGLEEFLSVLCQEKAGLPPNCYKDPETKIYVFEVEAFAEE
ncbi:MAG: AmmeMemoRadiSam system protein B [Patescibacteria group bacterium]|nr:AmmeMemoRadiSam system protein B [Patescibacteria group bacterium]